MLGCQEGVEEVEEAGVFKKKKKHTKLVIWYLRVHYRCPQSALAASGRYINSKG